MKSGLLGRKLRHSYSPQIHALMGNYSYDLFEKEPEDVGDFVRHGDYSGINVTIPYKKDVIPFLDELSQTAVKMGSVNTIVRRSDGSLYGHNTDYFGFTSMVLRSKIPVAGKKVLVLGSGGTSNTAVKALNDLGANVIVVSRTGKNHYDNLYLHDDASVIVNTTPVGMYPNTGVSPIDLDGFPSLLGVLDVIYNPARTQLLLDAEKKGLPNANGLWMLVAQAKASAEYFGNKPLSDDLIASVYGKLSTEMQNIVLIGMPGCGKSTVGKQLSYVLNRTFVDTDAEVESLAKKSIPDIFAQEGEEAFRDYETHILETLGKQSGLVLATGGGCVTREQNYPLLHQNSTIFWLKRSIETLPTIGRPLSQTSNLSEMYRQRKPMYTQFADFIVDNNDTIEDSVRCIMQRLEGNT